MNSPASPSVNEVSQEPKHTPGPWRSFPTARERYSRVICNADCMVEIAYTREVHGDRRTYAPCEETDANARLIAAAPDLLDAAKLGLSIAKSWIDQEMTGTAHAEAMQAMGPVRAAIARASGEKT